jgi:hypothetical protein
LVTVFDLAVAEDYTVSQLKDELIKVAKVSIFQGAQYAYLSSVIDEMVGNLISKADANNIKKLVKEGHEVIVASWDAFLLDNDLDELKDTLARIGRYGHLF